MMLIAPMIELMPIMWMAKITKATLLPPCSDSGGYSVQPPAGPAARQEQRHQQQGEGERHDPEGPVVHARQRHVRRADHQRHHPVGQADERRHHRAEDHHQRVHGGHLVEELGLDQLQARAGTARRGSPAPSPPPMKNMTKREHQVQGADVLVVGGEEPAIEEALLVVRGRRGGRRRWRAWWPWVYLSECGAWINWRPRRRSRAARSAGRREPCGDGVGRGGLGSQAQPRRPARAPVRRARARPSRRPARRVLVLAHRRPRSA